MTEIEFTKEDAEEFFAPLVGGKHHLNKITPYGRGWQMVHWNDLSTFDFNLLTNFVIHCHDKCVRGHIRGKNSKEVYLCIHKRKREGGFSERHPTIEDAIISFRK